MRNKRLTAGCLLLSVLVAFSACSSDCSKEEEKQTYTLIGNGKTEYSVLLSENASETEIFAAEELNNFCEESAGITFPVVREPNGSKTPCIAIGKTERFNSLGVTLNQSEYNYDGFIVKNDGADVIINGASERGTLYGVYNFLEDVFGVRFLAADYTYVPKTENLEFDGQDVKEIPAFRLRNYFSGDYNADSLFRARTRMYSGEADKNIPGYEQLWYVNEIGGVGHNSVDYVRVKDYETTHPEFFASYTNSALAQTIHDDLCYSNGITESGELDETMEISAAKVALESLKRYAEEEPDAEFFFIGIADHMGGWCMCDECNRRAEKFVNRTSTVLMFANCMAKEIQKWSDEKYGAGVRPVNVAFFAYFWCESAPVKYDGQGNIAMFDITDASGNTSPFKMEDNLWVRLAPLKANYAYSFTDERQTGKYRILFEQWGQFTDNIMLWNYVTYFHDYFKYFPNLTYFSDNIDYFKTSGVSYCMQQSSWGEQNDWQSRLKAYIAAKKYWENDVDVSALTDEFLNLYYGPAADYVAQFMQIMENYYAYLASLKGFAIDVTASTLMYNNAEYMPLGILQTGLALLNRGEEEIAADATLGEDMKKLYKTHLAAVQATPLSMILVDYDSYFPDKTEHGALCAQFVEKVQLAGFVEAREGMGVNEYMANHNITMD